MGTGRYMNWNDMLRYSFDEWHVRGHAGFLTGNVGNSPDRGKVQDYSARFTDDVLRTVKVDHYGVNTPAANADFGLNGQDANNFMSRPSTNPRVNDADPVNWIMPYFTLSARLRMGIGNLSFPFALQLAADPGNNSGIESANNYTRFNGSVRLSAEKIADMVTFDAIYRFRGGHPNDLDLYDKQDNRTGTLQPDGRGYAAHIFGLYANVLNVPKLGIGLGYTGYMMTYQDDDNTLKNITQEKLTTSGPLYSGIDLRLRYLGTKIRLTSVNNVSFASAGPSTGTVIYTDSGGSRVQKPLATSMGVLGTPLDHYSSQSWLGLYNALAAEFRLTTAINGSVQIANRYGLITTEESVLGGIATIKRGHIQLGGGGYVYCQINPRLLVQGGVAVRYVNDTYSNNNIGVQTNAATRNASGGAFDIAIPIRMSIVFEN